MSVTVRTSRVALALCALAAMAFGTVHFAVKSAGAASDPVVVAAGDVACDPTDANFLGANPSSCQQAATADEIASMSPQYVLPLGDQQYINNISQGQQPTLSQYQAGYGQSWGKLASRIPGVAIRPVPGNHDYGDAAECECAQLSAATNYFSYFGSSGLNELPAGVTASSNDWYSYDVPVSGGTWHVVTLDTVWPGVAGGWASGTPEETWFRNDLATHQNDCILVTSHNPRWDSGDTGSDANFSTLWSDAVAGHVTAVLAGHSHFYERFNPMDANESPSSSGTAEFIVGTGGVDHLSYANQGTPPAALAYQDDTHFGVLKMTLHAASMSYGFVSTSGSTLDSGTLGCSNDVPAVTALSPSVGTSAGGTSVSITGTNLTGATSVAFGSTPAKSFTVNSATSITAVAPAGSGTVDVTVTGPGGQSSATTSDRYQYTNSFYPVIQQKQGLLGSGASSTTVSLATPATAGDLLVATGAVYPGAAAGVSGPSGFTLAGSTPGAGSSGEYLWYKVAAGGETSFSFNQALSSSNYSEFGVTEISGGFTSVSVDGAPSWQSSSSKVTGYTQTYGSAPSASGELAFSFFVTSNATAQSTPSGWTLINSPTANNDNSGSYLEQAGTSAPSITTSGLSPSGGYTAGMVVFKLT